MKWSKRGVICPLLFCGLSTLFMSFSFAEQQREPFIGTFTVNQLPPDALDDSASGCFVIPFDGKGPDYVLIMASGNWMNLDGEIRELELVSIRSGISSAYSANETFVEEFKSGDYLVRIDGVVTWTNCSDPNVNQCATNYAGVLSVGKNKRKQAMKIKGSC
jgi:hypothetical protein